MLSLKYSPAELEKMKKIPGTFMWIKENEKKVKKHEKAIYAEAIKNRQK
ncbi:MAG: hypothetical protein K0R00_120 [Herbinix sp.]|jgi:hypothetical protein|nr:hypothetical protein [Herbinix sp.]